MSLAMQGSWTVSVKSKSAAAPQRFTISGAATGNGTHVVSGSTAAVPVSGPHWRITIEAQQGSVWKPSVMRFKNPVQSGSLVKVDIESNDFGADQDFNDLILTCTMPTSSADFVIYGHATSYSGPCWFNPCFRFHLVIDSLAQLSQALKNPVARAAIEKLYPELVLPGPKNPPDPAPLRTFTPLMLPTPRSPGLPPRTLQVTRTANEASTRQFVSGRSASIAMLDGALTQKVGRLLDGLQTQFVLCKTTTLGNYGLRFQEYDRTRPSLAAAPIRAPATARTWDDGHRSFRQLRVPLQPQPGRGRRRSAERRGGRRDATVQALPDLIAQVLGAGLVPAAETGCFFNVHNLQRIDICVPDTNIVLPSSCVDNKILTFIGKISMTSALNSLDATGRITAHSTAGNAPQIDCGVWWGNLDLWGCLGDDVARYTVRTRPLGGGPADWQFHRTWNGVKSPAACRRRSVPSRPGACSPFDPSGTASCRAITIPSSIRRSCNRARS
jgi:hypothetical protein